MKTLKLLSLIGILALCFAGGLYGGPIARTAYARIFPDPPYVTGNYEKLYAEAGRPVVLFSTSTCPYCKKTRALLKQEGVAYIDYVTDKSTTAEKKFKEQNAPAVPLIYIGNRKILGFNESTIKAALALLPPGGEGLKPSAREYVAEHHISG